MTFPRQWRAFLAPSFGAAARPLVAPANHEQANAHARLRSARLRAATGRLRKHTAHANLS
jgi:hypothetical protein